MFWAFREALEEARWAGILNGWETLAYDLLWVEEEGDMKNTSLDLECGSLPKQEGWVFGSEMCLT